MSSFCHPERVCESRDPGSFYAKTLAMLVGKIGVLRLAQRSLRMTEEEALTFRHSPYKFTNSHDDRRERGRSAALEEVVLPRGELCRRGLWIGAAHRSHGVVKCGRVRRGERRWRALCQPCRVHRCTGNARKVGSGSVEVQGRAQALYQRARGDVRRIGKSGRVFFGQKFENRRVIQDAKKA